MADLIGPGRYLCLRTPGFAPWVIRMATHGPADHAAVVVPGRRVVEAEPGGVIVSPLDKYAGAMAYANVGEDLAPGQLTAVADKALSLVGTEYNWAAISEDAAAFLGWHWKLLLHLAATDHDLDCSQLVAVCGKAAGADWLGGKRSYCEVTPADLARRPGVRRVRIG